MSKLIEFLQGKKAYILGLAAILYAILGCYLGNLDPQTTMDMVWTALTAMALRAGIAKSSN